MILLRYLAMNSAALRSFSRCLPVQSRSNSNEECYCEQAPPRAEVIKKLKSGIVINLLGLGSSVLGLQATVGVLVAKALTSSSVPYLQGASPQFSPVLALDVFLVQVRGLELPTY